MCNYEQSEQNKLIHLTCVVLRWNEILLLYLDVLQTQGCSSWTTFTSPCDAVQPFVFETEHQFKQRAIIAEATEQLQGPEGARAPLAMEIRVKTRQR